MKKAVWWRTRLSLGLGQMRMSSCVAEEGCLTTDSLVLDFSDGKRLPHTHRHTIQRPPRYIVQTKYLTVPVVVPFSYKVSDIKRQVWSGKGGRKWHLLRLSSFQVIEIEGSHECSAVKLLQFLITNAKITQETAVTQRWFCILHLLLFICLKWEIYFFLALLHNHYRWLKFWELTLFSSWRS